MMTLILNRMLSADAHLAEQLRSFAGQCIALEMGWRFCWQISAKGLLIPTRQVADAEIHISIHALPLLLVDRMAFNRLARIEKEEALGMAFAQILDQLHWDTEEELSNIIGDVMAHRLMRACKPLLAWPKMAVISFLHTLSDYYQQETGEIVGRARLAQFYQKVDALRADMDRLEKRIEHLLPTVTKATD